MSKTQREMAEIVVLAVTGHEAFSDVPVEITSGQLNEVHSTLVEKAMDGEINFKDTENNRKKLSDPKEMLKYIKGQTNDAIRKSLKLNGNSPYQAKNPGSRKSSSDEVIKAIKATMARVVDDGDALELCQAALETRLEEIRISNLKTVEIKEEFVPEGLKHLLG